MSDREPHDELWELLGKARPPKVSPFFARNVLRQVREQKEADTGFLTRVLHLFRRPVLAGAALAVVLSAGVLMWRSSTGPETLAVVPDAKESQPVAQELVSSPDYEVIIQLDELLAYEKNSVWIEDDNSTF